MCVCVCWPWPRLVLIDNIASICVCVCVRVFWPWPRWLLCVLCVIECVNLNNIVSRLGLGLGWLN